VSPSLLACRVMLRSAFLGWRRWWYAAPSSRYGCSVVSMCHTERRMLCSSATTVLNPAAQARVG